MKGQMKIQKNSDRIVIDHVLTDNHVPAITNVVMVVLYFIYMIKYYNISYLVPDYYNYFSFAKVNLPAAASFSSLFLDLSRFVMPYPLVAHVLCLSMLSLSVFFINLSIFRFLKNESAKIKLLLSLSTYTWGVWYYFCGKLYYDFPFTSISFAMALYLLSHVLDTAYPYKNKSGSKLWYVFYLLCGFTLSWKLFNLFAVFGIIILALLWRNENLKGIIQSISQYFYFFLSFAMGYILGMYHLLTDFQETLNGIRGYPVEANHLKFVGHFFQVDFTKFVWDHVTDSSFSTGIFFILSLFILLALPFLFVKKKLYALLGTSFLFLYCLYINMLSPGYEWHGFPFGLFLLVFFIFCFMEMQKEKPQNIRIAYKLISVMFLIQICNNFGYYIPMQSVLHSSIYNAIDAAYLNQGVIFDKISDFTTQKNITGHVRVAANIYRSKGTPSNFELQVFTDERFTALKTNEPILGNIFIEMKPKADFKNYYLSGYWDKINDFNKSRLTLNDKVATVIYDCEEYKITFYE
ncbi:hypothetical protein LQZ18_07005 [Lachnospiraceae bacterium ZAX-1]